LEHQSASGQGELQPSHRSRREAVDQPAAGPDRNAQRRRALVTQSDLPYPEGVACAEVLKVGGGTEAKADAVEDSRAGLRAVVWGSIVSAAFALVIATRIFASDLISYFRIGTRGAVSGFDLLFSFALFGIGHLIGLWVGLALFVGALIAWLWGVPHYSALTGGDAAAAVLAHDVWAHQVRFVGAGTIMVASLWTLAKLLKPVYGGLLSTLAASRARRGGNQEASPSTDRDIPIPIIGLIMSGVILRIMMLVAVAVAGTIYRRIEDSRRSAVVDMLRGAAQEAAEDVFFGQAVIIWARWFIILTGAMMTLWTATTVTEITINTLLIVILMGINFFLHGRYLMERPANRALLIAIGLVDLLVISGITLAWPGQVGVHSDFFVFYYPIVLAFAFVLTPRLTVAYTALALLAYAAVCLYAGADTGVLDPKLLVMRLITLAAMGGLGTYYWRIQRRRRRAARGHASALDDLQARLGQAAPAE